MDDDYLWNSSESEEKSVLRYRHQNIFESVKDSRMSREKIVL
jgi:hypothetical protein